MGRGPHECLSTIREPVACRRSLMVRLAGFASPPRGDGSFHRLEDDGGIELTVPTSKKSRLSPENIAAGPLPPSHRPHEEMGLRPKGRWRCLLACPAIGPSG